MTEDKSIIDTLWLSYLKIVDCMITQLNVKHSKSALETGQKNKFYFYLLYTNIRIERISITSYKPSMLHKIHTMG